jgi:hypothetical protein
MERKPQKSHFLNPRLIKFGEDLLFGSLSHTLTSWRVIPLTHVQTIREFESEILLATFLQFYEWIRFPLVVSRNETHPFHHLPEFSERKVAVYADYKHFHEIFQETLLITSDEIDEEEDLIETEKRSLIRPQLIAHETKLLTQNEKSECELVFDWKQIDENALDAEHGTLWIGSYGAHTPLHYDSYGRNVILQLYGEKLWSLWNPSEENLKVLSPSRIPYEESSIYADISKFDPKIESHLQRHPPDQCERLISNDLLHLPKHWWHYVTTVSHLSSAAFTPPPSFSLSISLIHSLIVLIDQESEISISINMWIPQKENEEAAEAEAAEGTGDGKASLGHDDRYDQITESLCRFIFGSVLDAVYHSNQTIPLDDTEGWYSPSEKSNDNEMTTAATTDRQDSLPPSLVDHDQNLSYLFASLAQLTPTQTLTEQQQQQQKMNGMNEEDENLNSVSEELSPVLKKRILQSLLSTLLHPSSLREAATQILQVMHRQVTESEPGEEEHEMSLLT